MNVINTTLTTSGNSTAVRLPKELLHISGLGTRVTLQAKDGQIIISKAASPREGWRQQIEKEIAKSGNPVMVDDYGDMLSEIDATLTDGLK